MAIIVCKINDDYDEYFKGLDHNARSSSHLGDYLGSDICSINSLHIKGMVSWFQISVDNSFPVNFPAHISSRENGSGYLGLSANEQRI